jgi:hypothetical protein
MHSQGTRGGFRNRQEVQQDFLRGTRAIREVQLMMLETPIQEPLAVIHLPSATNAQQPLALQMEELA